MIGGLVGLGGSQKIRFFVCQAMAVCVGLLVGDGSVSLLRSHGTQDTHKAHTVPIFMAVGSGQLGQIPVLVMSTAFWIWVAIPKGKQFVIAANSQCEQSLELAHHLGLGQDCNVRKVGDTRHCLATSQRRLASQRVQRLVLAFVQVVGCFHDEELTAHGSTAHTALFHNSLVPTDCLLMRQINVLSRGNEK